MNLLRYLSRMGPGLLFAATAVGTSHLVQSTRAGTEYGLSLIVLIILAGVVKYPAYLFGAQYAAATNKTLIENYSSQGRWALGLYACVLAFDLFVGTAAVALVTGAMASFIFGVDVDGNIAAAGALLVCAVVLISGRYSFFETITKWIVVLFFFLVVVSAAIVLPQLNLSDNSLTSPIEFSSEKNSFYIGLMGWMPAALTASVFQSIWVREKAQTLARPFSVQEASTDFSIGYVSSFFLAMCFVLIGTVVFFQNGVPLAQGASGFASQVTEMTSSAIGDWARPIVGGVILLVLGSTLLTMLDAAPRAMLRVVDASRANETGRSDKEFRFWFRVCLVIQIFGALAILHFFMNSFREFLNLAMGVAFVTAPFIATLNHRALFHSDVPIAERPGIVLRLWSIFGIFSISAFGVWYLVDVSSRLSAVW